MKKLALLIVTFFFLHTLSAQFWRTKGNSGLTSSHFIGTTNTAPLNFKVNNERAGYIDYSISNTSFGYQAMAVTDYLSAGNSAFGHQALFSNRFGDFNTAAGRVALYNNYDGIANTAFGDQALRENVNGFENTAVGYGTLLFNVSSSNTAIGFSALINNTTGNGNTATGYNSGSTNVITSTNCSFFGNEADQGCTKTLTNSTAIGYKSRITASNQVRIGNSSVKSIGGYVGWSNISDRRVKKDIKDNVPGLLFINKLKPVTYHLDITAAKSFLGEDNKNNSTHLKKVSDNNTDKAMIEQGVKEKERIVYTGLVAQDVEAAAKEIGYDFSGIDKPENEQTLYGLRYAEFVVPLVKAVQELINRNDEKDAKINELESRLAKLEAMMERNNQLTKNNIAVLNNASLEQNAPNPFSSATTITYTLPNAFTSAKMIITDMSGKALKEIPISGSGKGSVQVDASLLSGGAYQYSLYVDGKLINTRQMLRSK
jgi:hypothetical protein